jgi:hypothetical protein
MKKERLIWHSSPKLESEYARLNKLLSIIICYYLTTLNFIKGLHHPEENEVNVIRYILCS